MSFLTVFLSVVGGICLLVLAAAALGWMSFKSKMMGAIQTASGGLGPERITMQPQSTGLDETMLAKAAAFEALGYQRAGTFVVPEMPGVQVCGLVHPSDNTYAAVYFHPRAGVWSDVVLTYQDAGSLTVSNAAKGGMLDQRPGYQKVYAKDAAEPELVRLMAQSRRPNALAKPATASTFAADFEHAYADEMTWRFARGGASLEEIQRVADGSPEHFGREVVEEAREVIREQALAKTMVACRLEFARTMNGAEWELLAPRVLVVLDLMASDEVAQLLLASLLHPSVTDPAAMADQFRALPQQYASPFVLVERAAELLPAAARWTVAKELEAPARAWILVLPPH